MYRGDPPSDLHFSLKNIEYNLFYSKKDKFDFHEFRFFPKKSMILTLTKGPFVNIHMNRILNEYLMFDFQNKDFNKQTGECVRAQHKLVTDVNNANIQLLTVEVLHLVSQQWSSIKIMSDENVLATSHLIDSRQLPLSQQVGYDKKVFTLDPKYEKAMLIRNLNGDYAIVKGKWVGFRRKVLKAKNSSGERGDPGHLEISYYSFRTKKTHKLDVSKFLEFYLFNEYASFEVNLSTSKIIANFKNENTNLEIESSLALIYSISALHVLLQPKPIPYLDEKANRFKLPSLKSEKNILGNLVLSSCIGVAELIASESYYHYYKNSGDNQKKENWLYGEAAGFNELEFIKTSGGNSGGCGGGAAGCWGGISFSDFRVV